MKRHIDLLIPTFFFFFKQNLKKPILIELPQYFKKTNPENYRSPDSVQQNTYKAFNLKHKNNTF